jgi:hypothetical protein
MTFGEGGTSRNAASRFMRWRTCGTDAARPYEVHTECVSFTRDIIIIYGILNLLSCCRAGNSTWVQAIVGRSGC